MPIFRGVDFFQFKNTLNQEFGRQFYFLGCPRIKKINGVDAERT